MFAKYLTYTKHNFNIYDGLSHSIFTSGQVPFFERFHFMVKETDTHIYAYFYTAQKWRWWDLSHTLALEAMG